MGKIVYHVNEKTIIRKEKYKDIKEKTIKDFDKEYLEIILQVNKSDDGYVVKKKLENLKDLSGKYVWALFGKINGDQDAKCLQVASSNDIKREIIRDIKLMYKQEYSQLLKNANSLEIQNTQFYENVYYRIDNKNKREYIYSKMREEYDVLLFYQLNIDRYLGIEEMKNDNMHVNNMIEISKANYAEAKLAFETQAIYWNTFRGGIDAKALNLFNIFQ